MRFIISPAKKMNVDTDTMEIGGLPVYLEKAGALLEWLKGRKPEELKELWKCNDNITALNYERIRSMDLEKGLTPARFYFLGIKYPYIAPPVFSDGEWG